MHTRFAGTRPAPGRPHLRRALATGLALALGGAGCVAAPTATPDGPAPPEIPAAVEVPDPIVDTATPTPSDEGWSAPEGACAVYVPPPPGPPTLRPEDLASTPLEGSEGATPCLVLHDLDADGTLDLVFGQRTADGSYRVVVRYAHGLPGAEEHAVAVDAEPGACLPWDVDGDGALEVVTAARDGLTTLDGLADRAPAAQRLWGDDLGHIEGDVLALARLDLDLDGDLDLVVSVAGQVDPCGRVVVEHPGDTGDTGMLELEVEAGDGQLPGHVGCLEATGEGFVWSEALCPPALRALDSVFVFELALQDLGHDGRPDLFVAADFHENVFLRGTAEGWVDESASSGLQPYDHAMGAAWFDHDRDGLRDLFVPDFAASQLRKNLECTQFFDVSQTVGVSRPTIRSFAYGPALADFDQDGRDDLLVTQNIELVDDVPEALCLIEGGLVRPDDFVLTQGADDTFRRLDLSAPRPDAFRDWVGPIVVTGDLDGDGDVDAVVSDAARGVVTYHNQTPAPGHWIAVRAVDAAGLPVDGVRAVVAWADGHARVRERWPTAGTVGANAPELHVGLGDRDEAVTVRVRWPDGRWTHAPDVAVDQVVEMVAPTP